MLNSSVRVQCIAAACDISTPLGVGHLSRAAHGPKFKIPLPKSFVPGPLQYIRQVSLTSALRSRKLRVFENVYTAGTNGRTDI